MRQLKTVGHAELLGFGRFALHLSEDFKGLLRASKKDKGAGVLRAFVIEVQEPSDELTVVLCGRLSEAHGTPLVGLELLVLLAELDTGQEGLEFREPQTSELSAAGLGMLWGEVITDAAGQFLVRGLYPLLLTEHPELADGRPLELHLQRPSLVVELILASGERWAQPRAVMTGSFGLGEEELRCPGAARALVLLCESASPTARATGIPLKGWQAGPGKLGFDVEEGSAYLVGAIGGGFDGSFQRIGIPRGGGSLDLQILEEAKLDLGRVRVSVSIEGEPLKHVRMSFNKNVGAREGRADRPNPRVPLHAAVRANLTLQLEQLETGGKLLSLPPNSRLPFVFEAPPGRYRLVAESIPLPLGNGVSARSKRQRAQASVALAAGQEGQVELKLE